MMSVPWQISSFRGDRDASVGEAKKQGRRLPNVFISLRSLRRPCSGRMGPTPYLGPPIAPRRTACADWAAERAVSVRGVPCASIEHWWCVLDMMIMDSDNARTELMDGFVYVMLVERVGGT